ncbi:hypothetical protein HR060_00110 [Catenovulum sp. SM1970]|uniref:response regulator n=1 Tax=Marinifaba aquimaris TaxID=2741323 RepID=UPI0015735545|nr:response regulator [Marinifaba aquimaris]NTS75251.1 hypothetical protein [Marinifaba aquimaris]
MANSLLFINANQELAASLRPLLDKHFDVAECQTISEAIKLEEDYYIILINSKNVPEHELEQAMEFHKRSPAPAIIFLTQDENEENTLRCFELGAYDVISKNLPANHIVKKIKVIDKYKRLINSLVFEEKELNSLVDVTLKQAAFYGSSVNLLSDIQLADSEKALASMVFNYMEQQGLQSALHFEAPDSIHDFSQQTVFCTPIEKKVFSLLRDKGRIYEFKDRAMFNDEHVSLLVKNMPSKDSTEYSLLIDVLAKLIPALEMRYRALLNAQQLQYAYKSLQQAINDVQATTLSLQEERQAIIDNIVMQIGLSFHDFEFTESQEKFLIELIENSVTEQANSNEKFIEINEKLHKAMNAISPDLLFVEPPEDETNNQNIELF